jgi:glucokinase
VAGDTVRLTNLGWVISAETLRVRYGCGQVRLINDLVATAMGVPHLTPADLFMLNPGEPRPGAAMAVLAPGSGLGEAFVIADDNRRLPCPSEGGHASFAPRNEEQLDLLTFLRRRYDHVSVEQVCSGLALPNLFAFQAERLDTPGWLADELAQAADRTPVIVQAAIASAQGVRPCAIAEQTLRLFLDILADEAANLALKTLALGGVYLGGGLTARLLPLIDAQRFMAIFARGAYREMLGRIPVQVITNPETALLGAAACGIEALLPKPAAACR